MSKPKIDLGMLRLCGNNETTQRNIEAAADWIERARDYLSGKPMPRLVREELLAQVTPGDET